MCACWRMIGCRYPSTPTFRSGRSMFTEIEVAPSTYSRIVLYCTETHRC